MKRKITKLIDVKSIVTLSFTLVFCIMALTGKINDDEFKSLFTVIISFYFGTQYEKGKGDKNE
jgi:hypothetical protein